ncbi:hypothetical protein HAX54_008465 [Datura stramonium]|uniref:Uncharacterized protein n=1 Tax=Datura stramonium TaxID=4076 RepID=A0ABS8TDZ8_DATST|nr:hypothetical protein [Datura stramonium]
MPTSHTVPTQLRVHLPDRHEITMCHLALLTKESEFSYFGVEGMDKEFQLMLFLPIESNTVGIFSRVCQAKGPATKVTKWMLSKGQGRTMGSYFTLLNALTEDGRLGKLKSWLETFLSEPGKHASYFLSENDIHILSQGDE